jgi:uncharacterized protein YeaO (DUF488 family)
MIRIKRAYDQAEPGDGVRLLVDRIWPRGVKKSALHIAKWVKDVAPSSALRKWFGHDPARWEEFRRRYFAELDGQVDIWQPILQSAVRETVTFVYGARDEEHNNAVALRDYLLRQNGDPHPK